MKYSVRWLIVISCIVEHLTDIIASTLQSIDQYSRWNISEKIIFGRTNGTAGNDDSSLDLSDSLIDIDRNTDAIAVLDDNNGRVIVFNQSNTSTLFIILFDSSDSMNKSITNRSASTMAYDSNSSIYTLDGLKIELGKINSPLEFGKNATLISSQSLWLNGTGRGLCLDNTDQSILISDHDHHRVLRYDRTTSNFSTYVGNGTAGIGSQQLNNPTSIVMDSNRTLFVNDRGNKRIQMFKFNTTDGTTLPTNISDCIGLSLYSSNILVITTKVAVHLFNLTDNVTTCAIGCQSYTLNDNHHAIIDNYGNLIVADSNRIFNFSMEEGQPPMTTTGPPEQSTTITADSSGQSTMTTTASTSFNPTNNCAAGSIGISCNLSDSVCDMNKPCMNSGNCSESNTTQNGYTCDCPGGYNGTNCENDQRPCRPSKCLYGGHCHNESQGDFDCDCYTGYEGQYCELKVDLCANVTCENKGVCFTKYLNYTCQCLPGFYGRQCENTLTSTVVRVYVSKSLGYIAILMMSILIGFFVSMDVLKYVFGIDPARSQRNILRKKYLRRVKKKKQVNKPKIVYRFQYVS